MKNKSDNTTCIHPGKQVSFSGGVASILATQTILILFQAANGVITARLLGPKGKGLYAMCLLIASIVYLLATFNLQAALTYFAGRRQYSQSSLFSFACLATLFVSLLPAAALFLIPHSKLCIIFPGLSSGLWKTICLLFPFIIFTNLASGLLLGWLMIKAMNILKMVQSALCLFITMTLLIYIQRTAQVAICSYIISLIISTVYIVNYLRRRNISLTKNIDVGMVGCSIIYGAKGFTGSLFQFFNYRFDVFLVNYFLDPVQVGLYTVAVSLGELLWHLPNSIASMLFSKVAGEKGSYATEKVELIFRLTWLLVALAIIALLLSGKELITILFGKDFSGAYSALAWLLPGIFFLSMSKVMTGYFNGNGAPQYGSYSSVISFAVTLAADIFLIPRYGIKGAAIASSLSYICASAVVFIFFIRKTDASFPSLLSLRCSDIRMVIGKARSLCRG